MRLRAGLGAAILCGACLSTESFEPTPSAGELWAAMFEGGGSATITPLAPAGEARFGAATSAKVAVLGWRASQLPKLPSDFREYPLEVATACAPKLAPPEFVEFVVGAPSEVPRLTAPWLHCDPRPVAFQVSCRNQAESCPVDAEFFDGCSGSVRFCPAFAASLVGLELDGEGNACGTSAGECTFERGAELGRVSCVSAEVSCTAELYSVPESPPFQVVERHRVAPESLPPFFVDDWDSIQLEGFVSAMAKSRESILLATTDQPRRRAVNGPCAMSTLLVFESPELTATATIQDCIEALSPDPRGPGFLTLGRQVLRAVDERGHPTGETLTLPISEGRGTRVAPISPTEVVVMFRMLTSIEPRSPDCIGTRVFRAELETGRVEEVEIAPGVDDRCPSLQLRPSVLAESFALAFLDDALDSIVWFDRREKSVLRTRLDLGFGEAISAGTFAPGPEGRLLVAAFNDPGPLVLVDRVDAGPRFLRYERGGPATSLLSSPFESSQTLLAGLSNGRAFLGRFDWTKRRILTGEVELGVGPVSQMVADESSVWALLPWAGELVRVVLKP
ncbi:MAG: hypothetical protein HY791_32585 [Deltaproteobacteria bacterium]|nr:hypothetical protein [Deltaproteobacteria bacterium]